MDSERWILAWKEGRTPFHRDEVHPELVANREWFLGDGGPHRVLVPLCGKSRDMSWLADQGHQVVGVEVADQPVVDFFAENGMTCTMHREGHVWCFRGARVEIWVADFFKLDLDLLGSVDRIWDRAAMVALDPSQRGMYVPRLTMCATQKTRLMLNACSYDGDAMQGPPYSVTEDEVRTVYDRVELLSTRNAISEVPRFAEAGLQSFNMSTYAIEVHGAAPPRKTVDWYA